MGTTGTRRWLDEGLRLLAEQGAPAVTLDRMCERVGMSKGAFYHHFGSIPKFRTQLLAHFEAGYTTAIIDAVERAGDWPARKRLDLLVDAAVRDTDPALESAMRAWAKQDPEAAEAQERVDGSRIAYLRELCEKAGSSNPGRMATLVYLVLIGGAHLVPPIAPAEKHAMCDLVLEFMDATQDAPEAGPGL